MFLNRIFEKHLVETCGSKAGWDTQVKEEVWHSFPRTILRLISQAMDRFEAVCNGAY